MFWKERNLSDGALDWQRGKRRKMTGRNWNHSDIEIINNLYETVYKYKRR